MTNPSFTAHQYLSVLFDPDEPIWAGAGYLSKRDGKFGVPKMISATQADTISAFENMAAPNGVFLCINPAKGHNLNRAAENVSVFRNFLIEFDKGTLEEQFVCMANSGLPFSAYLWSGSKSLHFIISLDEPIETKELYKQYFERLVICTGNQADAQNKDVSRLSRFPSAMRNRMDATTATQQVCDIRGRVKKNDLMNILFAPAINQLYSAIHPIVTPCVKKAQPDGIPLKELNILIANVFAKFPLDSGEKHHNLFSCALALCANTDLDDDDIVMELADHDQGDHKVESEYWRAVRSARETVGNR